MTEVVSKWGLFSSSFLKNKGKHNLRKKKKEKKRKACRLYRQGVHFHVSVLCEVTQFSFVEKHAKGQTIFRAILHMEILKYATFRMHHSPLYTQVNAKSAKKQVLQ